MKYLKTALKVLLGIGMILAGVNHFLNAPFYLKMMPPHLPWHLALVQLSGVCEIALGLLLLLPRFTKVAAWGLILLFIAVFPANLYMAMNPHLYPEINPVALYWRLPFQPVFIAWAYWFTR